MQSAEEAVTVDPMIPERADEVDVDVETRRGRRLVEEAAKRTRAETASSASEAGPPTKRVDTELKVPMYQYRVVEEDLISKREEPR